MSKLSACVAASSFNTSRIDEVTSALLICCAVQSGCICLMSAAAPATCGDAIDVPPLNEKLSPSCPGASGDSPEKILTPGAAMLGFKNVGSPLGPRELKSAMISAKLSDTTRTTSAPIVILTASSDSEISVANS